MKEESEEVVITDVSYMSGESDGGEKEEDKQEIVALDEPVEFKEWDEDCITEDVSYMSGNGSDRDEPINPIPEGYSENENEQVTFHEEESEPEPEEFAPIEPEITVTEIEGLDASVVTISWDEECEDESDSEDTEQQVKEPELETIVEKKEDNAPDKQESTKSTSSELSPKGGISQKPASASIDSKVPPSTNWGGFESKMQELLARRDALLKAHQSQAARAKLN